MSEKLEKYNLTQLREMGEKMGLRPRRSKLEMIKDIAKGFSEYEEYKREKIDKYVKGEQLGEKGKEGTTFLVTEVSTGKKYAMKCFRKAKSSSRLKKEYSMLRKAGKAGISPKAYDYDTVSKYIVMERMDSHLYTEIDKNKGVLKKSHQERIIEIFSILDNIGLMHNDCNVANYMLRDDIVYMIDFGLAKEINPKLIKTMGTDKPNSHLMLIGLILKLKEQNLPEKSYKYLLKNLPEEYKIKYGL